MRKSLAALLLLGLACRPAPTEKPARAAQTSDIKQLSTGALLDPAGTSFDVGSVPLALVPAPEGDRAILVLSGWREQGIQVVRPSTGEVLQTRVVPSAFLGAAFSPDGHTLYVSGGNQDVIYRYAWSGGKAAEQADSIVLAVKPARGSGTRYAAGLAFSPDGGTLYAAENLADSLAVINVAEGRVTQRLPAGRYPYGVVVTPAGTVYVSVWGENEVRSFSVSGGRLTATGSIRVARHPSALLLNQAGTRLYVASGSTDRVSVIDPKAGKVIGELLDPPPAGPGEGSTPNALALSSDGARLFVAEADNNAVAVFDLSPATSDQPAAQGADQLVGRIPVGWYPTGVAVHGDTLVVVNAKGRGAGPNGSTGPWPDGRLRGPRGFTGGQLSGTVTVAPVARTRATDLAAFTERVTTNNHWNTRRTPPLYPPFEHVVYVIKENRTYDQVLGDLAQGDGDTSLVFFPRAVSPNHHALAERFGLFDRFLVTAEASPDGHNWSMAAYATDYLQKTLPSNKTSRGRPYDYEGANRDVAPPDGDDVAAPAMGYLWDLAQRKNLSFRNYGEFVLPEKAQGGDSPWGYRGLKPFLESHTNQSFPGFDMKIPDQRRADVWIADLNADAKTGTMPALEIVRLPNDHTEGARAGSPTPRAFMADNDLALGRMIDALSRSPFWKNTVVFVLEDDAQNGPDHVDSHRSVMLVISAYSHAGVVHRFVNTTDALVTMEEILGLGQLSQFDYYGRPLRDIWTTQPDLRAYAVLTPSTPLDERNSARGVGAKESAQLNFAFEDMADDEAFNHVLWAAIKGARPYPGPSRMSALEWKRAQ